MLKERKKRSTSLASFALRPAPIKIEKGVFTLTKKTNSINMRELPRVVVGCLVSGAQSCP